MAGSGVGGPCEEKIGRKEKDGAGGGEEGGGVPGRGMRAIRPSLKKMVVCSFS